VRRLLLLLLLPQQLLLLSSLFLLAAAVVYHSGGQHYKSIKMCLFQKPPILLSTAALWSIRDSRLYGKNIRTRPRKTTLWMCESTTGCRGLEHGTPIRLTNEARASFGEHRGD
jgi:hypothetical protein